MHRGHKLVALMVLGVSQFLGDDVRFCCAKTGGLGLAAALGHGFGEIREEHREPQPEDDLNRKCVVPGARYDVAEEKRRDEKRYDLDDEHHRVFHKRGRVEFLEGLTDGRNQDLRVRDCGR